MLFAVDGFATAGDLHCAAEAVGGVGELGRCAGVQAEFVDDAGVLAGHGQALEFGPIAELAMAGLDIGVIGAKPLGQTFTQID